MSSLWPGFGDRELETAGHPSQRATDTQCLSPDPCKPERGYDSRSAPRDASTNCGRRDQLVPDARHDEIIGLLEGLAREKDAVERRITTGHEDHVSLRSALREHFPKNWGFDGRIVE